MYTCELAADSESSAYVIHNVLPVLRAVLSIKAIIIIIIMYCICTYVCMHIGRIRVSNVHTIHVHFIAMGDLYS